MGHVRTERRASYGDFSITGAMSTGGLVWPPDAERVWAAQGAALAGQGDIILRSYRCFFDGINPGREEQWWVISVG